MNVQAYPLAWPAGWKRTSNRADGKFSRYRREITLPQAVQRLQGELDRMGVGHDVVLSTNVPTRLDGLPRGDYRQPEDPGAAVYWRDGGTTRCMAIDQYRKVEQNVAALAATIEAMRAIERHGGAAILERAFTGFAALPAPENWRQVLGADTKDNLSSVLGKYRTLRSQHHPDNGGTGAMFDRIEKAWQQAQAELQ